MKPSTIYEDGTYLENNPTWHAEDSQWKARQIATLLRKHPTLLPAELCEIGCGAGEIVNRLADEFEDGMFWGYEISPQAFEICRKKEKRNLHFHLADLLEQDHLRFKVVLAMDVIEHVEDYFGFLRKLRARGEYTIFHIPLDLSVQSVLRSAPIMHARQSVGHIHYFTKETALASLTDCGYEVLDYTYTRGALELPKKGLKAALGRLPRRVSFSISPDMAARIFGGFSLLVLAR